MKANELRIGNLVLFDDEIVPITGILTNGFYFGEEGYATNALDFFKPIPLTEEWMVKFGFKKYPDMFYGDFRFEIHFGNKNKSITLSETFELYNGIYSQQILFVHQLQNIYFALTGEELTIK